MFCSNSFYEEKKTLSREKQICLKVQRHTPELVVKKRTHFECCSLLIYSINSSPFSGSAWDVLILEKINFFLADSTFTMPRRQLDTVCYYLHINRSACDLGLREHHNRKSIVEIYSCDLMRISISFSIEGVAGDFTLPTRKLAFRRKILQRAGELSWV